MVSCVHPTSAGSKHPSSIMVMNPRRRYITIDLPFIVVNEKGKGKVSYLSQNMNTPPIMWNIHYTIMDGNAVVFEAIKQADSVPNRISLYRAVV
ncbi:protein of unknown function [Paenibacillus alvei]|uniref:Uncharacterized protein n=1 Tax=Paenibacillus alvei TaxID=44250 RepID=A0A383RG40_PAEAL|nr:protein of unknown function [Paenibacillus alvei]